MLSRGAERLSLLDLGVSLPMERARREVVDQLNLTIHAGETVALVGATGCGKTTTGLAIMGLLPCGAETTGHVLLHEPARGMTRDLLLLSRSAMRKLRGDRVAMIFQEPLAALNPVVTVGAQVAEALRQHSSDRGAALEARVVELFDRVGITDAERRLRYYPHELSMGLAQRVMIAMAIASEPVVLIADEPTSALDATIGAQILELIDSLKRQIGMGVLWITHDLNLASRWADSIQVMHRGRIVDAGPARQLTSRPSHPRTRELINCAPRWNRARAVRHSSSRASLVEACGLSVRYRSNNPSSYGDGVGEFAVNDVTISIGRQESLGLVGESGCGKTTLAKALLRLISAARGVIRFDGVDVLNVDRRALRGLRPRMQMIFQDPASSLNPRMNVAATIRDALRASKLTGNGAVSRRVFDLMRMVELDADVAWRFPHQLSGGQRQRVAMARALATNPEFVICDEPFSAVDAVTQRRLMDLLTELRARLGLSLLFISHDLAVTREMTDRVAVMYAGRIVETGPSRALFDRPGHPYTQALKAAALGRINANGGGSAGLPINAGGSGHAMAGCVFHRRCGFANEQCCLERPELRIWTKTDERHLVACHQAITPGDAARHGGPALSEVVGMTAAPHS